ncbi:MAG TPA: hypothetical protein ENI82_00155, partial [Bacteroidetes bacterium]|nr:hypothetical protein [Bacteroidota bacterium]
VIRYNNNQYWAATETGLVQIYNKAFQSFSYKDLPNIWTIIEDDKKDIYFGSYEGGLYKFDKINSTFSKVKTGVNYFAGSAKDDENRLYFAKSYSLEIKEGDEYKNIWEKTTFSVYYDSIRDRIIFGTFDGVGIFSDPDSIKYIGPEEGMHQCGYIQTVGMDKEGYYWAGSYTGVNRIDPVTYKTNSYTLENGKLNSKGIFCSFLDDSGNFWLGGDNGLMYYDYSRDSIILIESQLLNTRVKSMIDFDDKKLLLGTKEGLYIFDTYLYLNDNKIKLYYFNSSNGYTGIDPGFTGMYKDSKGYIWICSSTSVDRLNPRKIILKDQQPDILITKFNEKRIPFEHSKLILKNKYNDANSIIKFEAIGFEHPLNTKYQYRLNKSPWSEWQNEDQVILKDLSKGNYTFEVWAGPTDAPLESEKIDKLMFTINLPFYRSSWFLPFVFGLTALLIILTGFYYYSQRKEHKMYLKQLKEARYLRSQLLLSELNPHFIFNVLSTIQNKILFEEKELASEYVVKLSKLMRNFLNASHRANLMSSGKPDYEMQLSKEIELLKGFIEFEQIKSNYHFDYHIDIDKDIEPGYIMLPPMLIQPFVENSIKHGLLMSDKKGNLWIKIEKNENDLVINIEDDGIGIAESMKIHKKYNKTHKSLGSKIVMERIELLNKFGYQISIDILDRKPNGTIIKIIIKDEL